MAKSIDSRHKLFAKLCAFSINSYYVWNKEKRPIMTLLNKYISDDELQEFLEHGKIEKFELLKGLSFDETKALIAIGKREKLEAEIAQKQLEIKELENQLQGIE